MSNIGRLPVITGSDTQMFPNFDMFEKAYGKQIDRIRYGQEATTPDQHNSEAIIIHFTDGSKLGIEIVTNAANLLDEADSLDARIMASWEES